jgi:hypothetical protein
LQPVALAVITLGQPAFGNVIYDLAANPPAVMVIQGQNGTDTITVTLSMQSNEGARVQIPTDTTIMWQYLSGDRMDAVTGDVTSGSCFVFNNAAAVIGSNTINPGGNCSIVDKITMGDPPAHSARRRG